MQPILYRPNRNLQITAAMFPLIVFAGVAQADIYQWEYVNPADPSQGKRQSTTLAPDGAGIEAAPGANLSNRNLTMTYLIGADLTGANGYSANLTNADLTNADLNQANLRNTNLDYTTLTHADFTDAQVQGAYMQNTTAYGFTSAQLYATASYKAHDLTGIHLYVNDLSGWNFVGQNLTNASFWAATLTDADFSGAEVRGADFYGTGITLAQLYSTASHQAHDLSGISLLGINLADGNFAGQKLSNAKFAGATLTGADFTNADVWGADFTGSSVCNFPFCEPSTTGITLAQLYSTASYQAHDLSEIKLSQNDLSGANFVGQNLTNVEFYGATLTDSNFTGAEVRGANFYGSRITLAQLYSTASHQAHDLRGINLGAKDLSGAYFAGQNLTDAGFTGASLADVDFSGADIRGARFDRVWISDPFFPSFGQFLLGTGITPAQLYSTSSYQAGDLSGINFAHNKLAGGNFAGQKFTNSDFNEADLTDANLRNANLTNANFSLAYLNGANLTGADMTGAEVRRAGFQSTTSGGFTAAQLYSTASYQAHDLTGIYLGNNDLSGWNFAGQNLTTANFYGATLTSADLTGAYVHGFFAFDYRDAIGGANFSSTTSNGLTAPQLYSTASYQTHSLSGISLNYNDLSGWNFAGQNLSAATFYGANLRQTNLTGASFRAAVLFEADLTGAEVRGADFSRVWDWISTRYRGGIAQSQLYSTASYQVHDLTGIGLSSSDLSGWNFRSQNLTNAAFRAATLTDADFTGAEIRSADFDHVDRFNNFRYQAGTGIGLAQLYSTASYQSKDLSGIGLNYNDLAGGNFAHQKLRNARFNSATLTGADFRDADLTNATFFGAKLTNADFTGAEVRGAVFVISDFFGSIPGPGGTGIILAQLYSTASYQQRDIRGVAGIDSSLPATMNLILPNGHVNGLDLHAGDSLTIRDFNGNPTPIPVSVEEQFTIGPGGTLETVFEADAWDSTISFAPSIPVTLGGTLELTFAPEVNLASQVGRTFDLFDWTGVTPTGAFAISSPYRWDVSNLYTSGEVTLTAVPEPSPSLLFGCGLAMLVVARRDVWRRSGRVLHGAARLLPLMAYSTAARPDIFSWQRREIHELLRGAAEAQIRPKSINSRETGHEVSTPFE